jgi:hypothetical protein
VPGERFSTKGPDTFTQTVASLNFNPLAVRRRTIHYRQLTKGRRRFFLLAICKFDSDLIRAD